MDKLGKLFVFLNLIAAIGLVAWAVSLTVNRLDWVDKPEGFNANDENPNAADTNNLERVASKVSKWNDGIKASQTGLANKSTFVIAAEAERDSRYAALQRRITDARTGRFRQPVYRKNSGLLDLAVPGDEVLGLDNKPLVGLNAIERETNASIDTQGALIKQSVTLRTQFDALSGEITLLDEEIDRQKIIKANAEEEGKYLADRATDWDEQVRTLQRRMKQLTDTLAEVIAAPKKPAADGKVSSNARP